jgi:peptide/nickel transport system ATP-binding protein
VLAYLIRRLFAAVSDAGGHHLVTFGIFFLSPSGPGVTPPALRRQAGRPRGHRGHPAEAGLWRPDLVQYWHFFKGLFAGRDYANGGDVTHCAAPCFGYSFRTEQAVWPLLTDRLPVTLARRSAPPCCGWSSVSRRRALRAQARHPLGPRGDDVALAGVSLPIYFTGLLSLAIFVYGLGWIDAQYTPFNREPGGWFGGLILPWITLAFLYAAMYARLTRATMLETLGEDYIRTARAKGLRRTVVIGKHAMRSALTPILTIFGLDLGAAARRRDPHRDDVQPARPRPVRARRDQRQRPAGHPGRHPDRRVLHRARQPRRGPAVRRDRPAGEALGPTMTELSKSGAARGRARHPGTPAPPRLPRSPRPEGPLPDRRRPGQVRRRAQLPLEKGKTLGIVGESGSGKSVTSLGIMGLHRPAVRQAQRQDLRRDLAGRQELLGADPEQVRKLRGGEMAMIFQDPLSRCTRTTRSARRSSRRTGSTTTSPRRSPASARSTCSTGSASRSRTSGSTSYPHQFSGGMRQRAMIAMALVNDPELLIADEPTTALDVTVQAQILDLIRDLQREFGSAVIIITHDLGVVAELADDILVMYGGRCVERARPRRLLRARSTRTPGACSARCPAPTGSSTERLIPIKGSPPSLINLPSGCAFHPRCPYADVPQGQPVTRTEPRAARGRRRHWSACHLTRSSASDLDRRDCAEAVSEQS